MYEVLMNGLPSATSDRFQARFFAALSRTSEPFSENPRPAGCHKLAGSRNDWRIRIGDYRVIYEIEDRQKLVKVFRVRHRREVYR